MSIPGSSLTRAEAFWTSCTVLRNCWAAGLINYNNPAWNQCMESSFYFTLGQKVSHFSNVSQGNVENLEMGFMWVSTDILIEQKAKWFWGQVNVAQQNTWVLDLFRRCYGPRNFQFFLSSTVGHFGHPDLLVSEVGLEFQELIRLVWLH